MEVNCLHLSIIGNCKQCANINECSRHHIDLHIKHFVQMNNQNKLPNLLPFNYVSMNQDPNCVSIKLLCKRNIFAHVVWDRQLFIIVIVTMTKIPSSRRPPF